QKSRVGDSVEPCEELRSSVETAERFPCLSISILRQIGCQITIAAQPVQRCVHRGVCPFDELFRCAAIAAANRREKTARFIPRREHRLMLLRSAKRCNLLHTSWTPLRDSWKPRQRLC